jgi:hypothetical protein
VIRPQAGLYVIIIQCIHNFEVSCCSVLCMNIQRGSGSQDSPTLNDYIVNISSENKPTEILRTCTRVIYTVIFLNFLSQCTVNSPITFLSNLHKFQRKFIIIMLFKNKCDAHMFTCQAVLPAASNSITHCPSSCKYH